MRTRALFHKLGTLTDGGDAYLEKYSRSLIWLARELSSRLAAQCDKDVEIAARTMDYLGACRRQETRPQPRSIRRHLFTHGVELTLVTTTNCNLDCGYCFARELYQSAEGNSSAEIITAIERFLTQCSTPVSSLILFGGEPLLSFRQITKAWPEVIRLFRSHQQKTPSFALVTNGSLINANIAAFLAEHDFAVTVSLDGPKRIHDLCRPRRRGESSYDAVVAGINKLLQAGVYLGIEATYTHQHVAAQVRVTDVVDHALELGARETHVMPAFPARALGMSPEQYEYIATDFACAARRAAKRYLESEALELSYAVNVVYSFAHNKPRRYICTAGVNKFTVMTNGDIVPCYLMCDREYKIGSTRVSPTKDASTKEFDEAAKMYIELSRNHLPDCSICWAADWCFACYGPGFMERGELGAPRGLECKLYKAMIEAALLECAEFLSTHRKREGPLQSDARVLSGVDQSVLAA